MDNNTRSSPRTFIADSVKCVRCHDPIPRSAFRASATTGSGVWDEKCYIYMTGLTPAGETVAKGLSEAALRTELAAREQQRADDERARKNEQAERITENIDALLLVVPQHSRTSCSDADFRQNSIRARCTRCVLLEAAADGYWRNDIDLDIIARYDPAHASGRK